MAVDSKILKKKKKQKKRLYFHIVEQQIKDIREDYFRL